MFLLVGHYHQTWDQVDIPEEKYLKVTSIASWDEDEGIAKQRL